MTVEQTIRSLEPSDGWWKDSAAEAVESTIKKMVEKGFTPEEAADTVGDLIGTIRNEYGD